MEIDEESLLASLLKERSVAPSVAIMTGSRSNSQPQWRTFVLQFALECIGVTGEDGIDLSQRRRYCYRTPLLHPSMTRG